MRSRLLLLTLAFLLCGCAVLTTTKQRPTSAIRNDVVVDSVIAQNFQAEQLPDARKMELNIALEQQLGRTRQYQRRHIEKRRLKPAVRVALWATGASIAGGGFYLYAQAHWSRLGELAMGAGGLIPLGGEIITASLPPVGEEWKEESRVLPPRTEAAVGVPVTVNTLNSTWSDTTDEAGTVTVDFASLADSVTFGEPLEVQVVLLEDTASGTFTVPVEIVDAYRTPPVVEFAVTEVSVEENKGSMEAPIRLSKPWHENVHGFCYFHDNVPPFALINRFIIPVGDTALAVEFPILDNSEDEDNKSDIFTLKRVINATIGADSILFYTIIDDDPPPRVQFSVPVSSGSEAFTPAKLPVILSSPSGLEVSVEYSVTGGTSEGRGVDFILEVGTLSIPMGDTSASIEFHVIDDAAVEGEETVLVSLSNPINTTLGVLTSHTYIIKDNDEAVPVVPVAAATSPVESPSSASQLTIAILDFEGIGVSSEEARVLTNRLGTHMVQLGRYQVIERGQMEQILNEQDFQMTGCTSNECAVEIGQLIGAQQMLAGSFGKLGTVYTIDMRIIDVVTGRITKTTSYDIDGSISRLLTEGLAEAVRRIAGVD